jgi:hypothetical protein
LHDLTAENQCLRKLEQRLTLKNDETLIPASAQLPGLVGLSARPVRPLPVPMSAPLHGGIGQVPVSSASQRELEAPSELPNDSSRTEVGHLREMIERLMGENMALKMSVQEMQHQRNQMGQVEIVELTDTVEVGDFPPPYEESIS